MNDKPEEKKPLNLSALDFGPAWARREDTPSAKYRDHDGPRKRSDHGKKREDNAVRGNRGDSRGDRKSFSDAKGPRRDGGKGRDSGRPPRPAPVAAPAGIVAEIMPIEEGIDNLAKEIIAAGRTYSVFDLARVILSSRDRYKVIFSKAENGPDLFQCKEDGAVFLTKCECMQHFKRAAWKSNLYTSEVVEVDAPSGNFQSVSKCGFSGEVFGPSNFHAFSQNVVNSHQARFSHMELGKYKARIVTDSSPEAVNAWLETMKKQTQYRPVNQPELVIAGDEELEKHFETSLFDEVYRATHRANVDSQIAGKLLSPGLLTLLTETIADQRRYPGRLASFLCRQLSGRHLAVFKWQGKLHAGPSRAHALTEDIHLADRPAAMMVWIRDHSGAGIDELWKAVLPADIDAEDKKLWYHDLHWMINQGYVIFMSDGHIFDSNTTKKSPEGKAVKAKPAVECADKTEAAEPIPQVEADPSSEEEA